MWSIEIRNSLNMSVAAIRPIEAANFAAALTIALDEWAKTEPTYFVVICYQGSKMAQIGGYSNGELNAFYAAKG